MTAVRQKIIDIIDTQLSALDGVKEVQVNASGDPTDFPALFIDDGAQRVDLDTEPGVTRYDMELSIEGYIKGGDGRTATKARNALYLQVVAALVDYEPLFQFIEEINEGDARFATVTLSSQRRMGFSLVFNIRFAADRQSPSAPN